MSEPRLPHLLFLEALPMLAGGQTVLVNLVPGLTSQLKMAALLPGEGSLASVLRQLDVECFFAPIGRYSLMRKHFINP